MTTHGSGSSIRTHGSGSTIRTHGSGSGSTTRGVQVHGCLVFLVLGLDLLGDELRPLHGLDRLKTGVLVLLQLLASVVTATTATKRANKITTRIVMFWRERVFQSLDQK